MNLELFDQDVADAERVQETASCIKIGILGAPVLGVIGAWLGMNVACQALHPSTFGDEFHLRALVCLLAALLAVVGLAAWVLLASCFHWLHKDFSRPNHP